MNISCITYFKSKYFKILFRNKMSKSTRLKTRAYLFKKLEESKKKKKLEESNRNNVSYKKELSKMELEKNFFKEIILQFHFR